MILEGLLVDLVPYGKKFQDQDYTWWNSESTFWGSMGGRQIVSKAEVEREHEEWRTSTEPETGVAFGVQTKDGKPIGYFGINWLSPQHRYANLGAVIGDQAYWGGGYGTDALLLLNDYAFDVLDMRRVWLITMALNERVIRQMEKVGFKLEGRHRQATRVDRDWIDVVSYGLLREEWPGRAAMIEKIGLKAR